jgi:hypothetical protein
MRSRRFSCGAFLQEGMIHRLGRIFRLNFILSNIVKAQRRGPGQALRVPGGWSAEFLDNRHMKVVRLSALRTGRLYPPPPPGIFPDWVDLRAIVRLEGLCQWKIPVIQSGIESATAWLVAQCATACRPTLYVARAALAKFGLHAGNVKRNVRSEEWTRAIISLRIILPECFSIHRVE